MQKKIIALAVAGLVSGGAFAQSNVTISGEFKVGFEGVSAGGATVANQNMTSRTRVTDNNSKLKFAGEEALGNGLTAWFQVESAIGTSDNTGTTGAQTNGAAGANQTTIGTRNTAVGLKGAWGNVYMGKWDAYYNTIAAIDTMGLADGHGLATSSLDILQTNGAVSTATGQGAANSFGSRYANSIMYSSPNWGGFMANVNYSTQSENTAANMNAKDHLWAFNPVYNNGPLTVFYAYLKISNTGAVVVVPPAIPPALASGSNATANRLGASWTFPMGLKIGLAWDKNKLETADGSASLGALGVVATGGAVAAQSRRERTAWALPIQWVTGPHKVNFSYARSGDLKTDMGTVGDSGAKLYVLGYEYSLSKRTSVATSYTMINNGNNAAYDGWHPSSSVAGSSSAALSAGADPRILQVNIRHAF